MNESAAPHGPRAPCAPRAFALLLLLAMLVSGVPTLAAQPPPDHGSRRFSLDLDGDGTTETILTRPFASSEEGDFYQLQVLDSSGRKVWSGPQETDSENPLVFGAWHHGLSFPEVIGDIQGEGDIELVAPAPASDVSPTTFRIARWTGNRFKAVREISLLEDNPDSHFYKGLRGSDSHRRWIHELQEILAPGQIRAAIWELDAQGSLSTGSAIIKAEPSGYRVERWERLLMPCCDNDDMEMEDVRPLTQKSTTEESVEAPVTEYICQIGPEDQQNSKNEPLTKPAEILAQDRANYHRYGIRHRSDGDDTYFQSPANRALFERLPVKVSARAQAAFQGAYPVLQVRIYGDRIEVDASR